MSYRFIFLLLESKYKKMLKQSHYTYLYLGVWVCMCLHTSTEVRGQRKVINALLPPRSDPTQVISLSTQLSHWLKNVFIWLLWPLIRR